MVLTGKLNLFVQQGATPMLCHTEVTERIRFEEMNGINFIDNKNVHRTSGGCAGMLIAFKLHEQNRWNLGVIGVLHPALVLITECYYSDINREYIFVNNRSHKLNPYRQGRKIDVHYLNLVISSMTSPYDGCLESPPNGPDWISHSDLPKFFTKQISVEKKNLTPLFHILDGYKYCKDKRKLNGMNIKGGLLNLNTGSKASSVKALKADRRHIIRINENHVQKDHTKGFAFPLVDCDTDGFQTFCLVDQEAAKEILKGKQYPKEKYNDILRLVAKQTKTVKVCTPIDDGLGIEVGTSKSAEVIETQRVEPWEREGILMAMWARCDSISFPNRKMFEFMLEYIYGEHGFSRSSTSCFGLNTYLGKRLAEFLSETPRYSKESRLDHQFNRQEFDMLFMPLMYKMTNVLSEKAVQFQKANDRVYDRFLLDVHGFDIKRLKHAFEKERSAKRITKRTRKVLPRKAKQIRKPSPITRLTNLAMRRASSLSIITCGNLVCRGFTNKAHIDKNDGLNPTLRAIARIVVSAIKDYLKRNEHLPTLELRQALDHIIRLGGKTKRGSAKFDFSTYTTCGYELMLDNSKVKKSLAFFLYNDLSIAVRIPENKGVYHTFAGKMVTHQTTVPITFDGTTVRLDDPDLLVFAWGAGKSEKRVFLEDAGDEYNDGRRFRQRDLLEFYQAQANEVQREYIENRNWLN